MAERYDVVIIGAGPGGYVAAIRAAQLGLRTACVESRGSLGGTCLNIGCIPSKALLQSSEKFAEARHALAEHGIKVGEVGLDLGAMMARKDKVVTTLTRGVEFLFRKNKVDWLKGTARIAAPGRVAVAGADGSAQRGRGGRDRHRHRLGKRAAARHRDRRAAHPVVDRGLGARSCAGAARGDRRRLYRARAGLGVAAARGQGDGGRAARPHRPEHGPGIGDRLAAGADAPGDRVQARRQGGRHRAMRPMA